MQELRELSYSPYHLILGQLSVRFDRKSASRALLQVDLLKCRPQLTPLFILKRANLFVRFGEDVPGSGKDLRMQDRMYSGITVC